MNRIVPNILVTGSKETKSKVNKAVLSDVTMSFHFVQSPVNIERKEKEDKEMQEIQAEEWSSTDGWLGNVIK